MLRRADAVSLRSVHHNDAPSRCGGDVDVVHARSRASDDFQLRGHFQHVGRHSRLAAHDQNFGLGQGRPNLVGAVLIQLLHLEPGLRPQ